MKRATTWAALGILLAAGAAAVEKQAPPKKPEDPDGPARRHIDLALCLDTSGSMRGLIESAKQKLWAVVNELETARPRPLLRVALYQYGNSGLTRASGWVQQLSPLTEDLDAVYGKLFPLRTNGGTEYVARVVRAATQELEWDRGKGTLRMVFVAGNEAATQDNQYPLQDTCKAAASRGVIVNTIFCGADSQGRSTGWLDAARWADGQYAAIDQDRGTVVINTPYDKELADLSAKLNTTYLAYGRGGAGGKARQMAMDRQAGSLSSSAAAERAESKASGLYRAGQWDLVDAAKDGKVKLEALAEADLPEPMKKLTPAERKAYVIEMAKRRAEIQKAIQALSVQRTGYVKKEMSRRGLNEKASLDAALRSAARTQAEKKGFEFEKK